MSDLSVFDVQNALKFHADTGHDVTGRPHQIGIDGKTYNGHVGSTLMLIAGRHGRSAGEGFNLDKDGSSLISYMTPAERHIVSEVYSRGRTQSGTDLEIRPYIPRASIWDTSKYSSGDSKPTYDLSRIVYKYKPFYREERSHEDFAPGLYYNRDESYQMRKGHPALADSSEEAIQNHQKAMFKNNAELAISGVHSGDSRLLLKSVDDMPGTFNHQQALSDLMAQNNERPSERVVKPNSGLIVVNYQNMDNVTSPKQGGWRQYTYSPDTEQLLRVN